MNAVAQIRDRRFWSFCRLRANPTSMDAESPRFETLSAARAHARAKANELGASFVILATIEVVRPNFDGNP